MKSQKVDLIIHNAQIHTLDPNNTIYEAIAIKDGKILELGPQRQILNKYSAKESIDAQGKEVYPGFIDAHGHMLMYAKQLLGVDLRGVRSQEELVLRCEQYKATHPNLKFLIGRGWDQTLWADSQMPTNHKLNALFKDIPVCLYRIDGHAALVNEYLIQQSAIVDQLNHIQGGAVVFAKTNLDETKNAAAINITSQLLKQKNINLQDYKPTGVLIDNAVDFVQAYLPNYSKSEYLEALVQVQDELLQYGITGVHEAGIDFEHIAWFKELISKNKLSINIYAMLMDSPKNRAFATKHGPYEYKSLSIRSFKCFADGALGSRGALLKAPYDDHQNDYGLLLTDVQKMNDLAKFCLEHGYQMNTHSIGDSANALVLSIYEQVFNAKPDHRFRIEHAQILDPKDFLKFSQFAVFPSVQPTHAISDADWAEKRLGKHRLKGAYAYRTLLEKFGMLALGTDFPVEQINPFATIEAALYNPFGETLELEAILRGMTIHAAFAAFQENRIGSLEKGKEATLVILNNPISEQRSQVQNYAWRTFIRGKCVFKIDEL